MNGPSFVRLLLTASAAWVFLLPGVTTQAASTLLSTLDLSSMSSGWGEPKKNLSVTGQPLRIGARSFEHGIGTHANSELWIQAGGQAQRFQASVGVDAAAGDSRGSVEFFVFGDGQELWRSGVCRFGDEARPCSVDLDGVVELELVVTDAGDGTGWDHADWAEAVIEHHDSDLKTGPPAAPSEKPVVLTPPAPREPRINGPKVTALRPGSPLIFRIPCTGARPIEFSVAGLPEGIHLDAETGIMSGSTTEKGTHRVAIEAKNIHGATRRELRLVVGDTLALTPPMGWNSWYIHYNRVTEQHMRQAAEQMIETGMADYGYQYVNIDDCWMKGKGDEPYRTEGGELLTNSKFPDIKGMVDYIHALGLRAGTYISPGPWTCAGYVGSWEHEAQDAAQFAEWGFDFLKYDWCSYGGVATGEGLEHFQKPYRVMWEALQRQDRDIVHNLCQYGMGEVWTWGGEVGNCWRTTGDLGLERGGTLPGFYSIALSNARRWAYARPGAWNDPDYVLIGWVGDAQGMGEGKPTTLTPNEQYSYMSLWSLMAAPLVFSGDMAQLDAFTLNILCNPEVIDIDQDPLGQQARIIRQSRHDLVLAKPLEDGSLAVGLFNLAPYPRPMQVTAEELELTEVRQVRDVWRQKDLGKVSGVLKVNELPRHGVLLVRLASADSQ